MHITDILSTKEATDSFYPTPMALADELVSGLKWEEIKSVLEPSAGKGDLAKRMQSSWDLYSCQSGGLDLDCVEIDPMLGHILRGEGLRVVHDDFLSFDTRKHYDLILMNPPFADGDKHLMKAITMQSASGGFIRCLLNAETLNNPCTNLRKLLKQKLDELGAEIKLVNGAFLHSERSTEVSVAVVKISIPRPVYKSAIYERLKEAAEVNLPPMDGVSDLAIADLFQSIVSQYNVEVDAGIELIQDYLAMQPYIMSDFEVGYGSHANLDLIVAGSHRDKSSMVNDYVRVVRKKYWRALFTNEKFVGKLTSNLSKKYEDMMGEMVDYDFTLYNIQQIEAEINAEMASGVRETILKLFDKFSLAHSWYPETQNNIHYYSGWETNKVHKVGSKVIIPTSGLFSDISWSKETFKVRGAENVISDIEKSFNYL